MQILSWQVEIDYVTNICYLIHILSSTSKNVSMLLNITTLPFLSYCIFFYFLKSEVPTAGCSHNEIYYRKASTASDNT